MLSYISTRGGASVSGAEAVMTGQAPDGGLFCPSGFPVLTADMLSELASQPYAARCAAILSLFLEEFTRGNLTALAERAYSDFDGPAAPVKPLDDRISLLELWHGPTSAFKDMALQMLPSLMTGCARKTGEKRRVCILTATSGDTGKAALEAFRDREGTAVFVFYPLDGVSNAQKLQMVTQEGGNVGVCAIRGNFDHAQSGVKSMFSDTALAERLNSEGWMLSSANSINPGRLLPQVAYYVSAYCDMTASGRLRPGGTLDVTVPTGNFGNILAAYYAKAMGLPIGRLVCASNRNNVLSDFLNTGVYDSRRTLYTTTSPSMDILVSSNFERALFHLSGQDSELVRGLMDGLASDGLYTAPDTLKAAFDAHFTGGFCDDQSASAVIRDTWREHKVLLDPHTAVAADVARRSFTENPMLVVSTASPFKFSETVLKAVGGTAAEGADAMNALSEFTGIAPPVRLSGLDKRPVRFADVSDTDGMRDQVNIFLEKQRG